MRMGNVLLFVILFCRFGYCADGGIDSVVGLLEENGAKVTRDVTLDGAPVVSVELKLWPAHSLPDLSSINSLRRVSISRPSMAWSIHTFSNEEVGGLLNLPQLASIKLSQCRIADQQIAMLRQSRSVRQVEFDQVEGMSGRGIGEVLSLESVSILACPDLDDSGMASIAQLPRLKSASVEPSRRVTKEGIQLLNNCRRLSSLSIRWSRFDVEDGAILALPANRYSLSGLKGTIERLSISDEELGDTEVEQIAALEGLKVLAIDGNSLSQSQWNVLARLEHLERLELKGEVVRNAPLSSISKRQCLTEVLLEFSESESVSNEVMAELAKMPFLKSVEILRGGPFTAASLETLSSVCQLEGLKICGIGSSGLSGIAAISRMSKLRTVDIDCGLGLSKLDAEKTRDVLKKRLPEASVKVRYKVRHESGISVHSVE